MKEKKSRLASSWWNLRQRNKSCACWKWLHRQAVWKHTRFGGALWEEGQGHLIQMSASGLCPTILTKIWCGNQTPSLRRKFVNAWPLPASFNPNGLREQKFTATPRWAAAISKNTVKSIRHPETCWSRPSTNWAFQPGPSIASQKIACTIADLQAEPNLQVDHISEPFNTAIWIGRLSFNRKIHKFINNHWKQATKLSMIS